MIDRQKLLDELESLSRQETEKRADLMRIEGAVQMARHLLGCIDKQESEAGAGAAQQSQPVPTNGRPPLPHGPENEIGTDGNDGADFNFH